MSDRDEIGRPNYTRGSSPPSPSRIPAPRGPEPRAGADLGAWMAFSAMLATVACNEYLLGVPLFVGVFTAILAVRWGLKSRHTAHAPIAVVAANVSWVVAALFLLQAVLLIFDRYFVEHQGFGAAIHILLT